MTPTSSMVATSLRGWIRRTSMLTREYWFRTGLVCLLVLLLLQYMVSVSVFRKYHTVSSKGVQDQDHSATPLEILRGSNHPQPSDESLHDREVTPAPRGFSGKVKDFFARQGANVKSLLGLTSPPPPPCESKPQNLVGKLWISTDAPSWEELNERFPDVEPGGRWRPKNCTSRHRVAIILPYRDREEHLRIFLDHMHPLLMRQELDYGIYVIEQDPYSSFNRGLLLNVGYVEAKADAQYDCYIFHDVDLLPENDRNLYTCPTMPRHMSAAVDEFRYRLPYDEIFGGVEAFRDEHFSTVNGFSNMYFGWGGEDDDLYSRIMHHGFNISRPSMTVGRYTMIRHKKSKPSPNRYDLLDEYESRLEDDGLNSLVYDRKRMERRKLYTLVYAHINMTDYIKPKHSTTELPVSSTPNQSRKKRRRKRHF